MRRCLTAVPCGGALRRCACSCLQAQSQEFKHEVERLARELQDAKRKLYEQRRRDQLAQVGSKLNGRTDGLTY